RIRVDFPHPEGPMTAVIVRWGRVSEMDFSTWCPPNPASKPLITISESPAQGSAVTAGLGIVILSFMDLLLIRTASGSKRGSPDERRGSGQPTPAPRPRPGAPVLRMADGRNRTAMRA